MVSTKKIIAAGFFACSFALFAQSVIIDAENVAQFVESEMVSVAGGKFMMGSEDNENNEKPLHQVSIGGFSMLRTEVTQDVYKIVMGENYSHFKGKRLPVEEVSWYDAVIFCNRLSILSGREPVYSLDGSTDPEEWGDVPRINDVQENKDKWDSVICDFSKNGYRLPTEAEWEYAAGSAEEDEVFVYSGSSLISDVAWNRDTEETKTYEAARKAPNALGLYDMSGNVWEWCWDWYGNYNTNDRDNPKGAAPDITGRRIRRGGSILSDEKFCRNANRASSEPSLRGIDLGFRVVITNPVLVSAEAEEDFEIIDDADLDEEAEK